MKSIKWVRNFILIFTLLFIVACNNNSSQKEYEKSDTIALRNDTANASDNQAQNDSVSPADAEDTSELSVADKNKPVVLIYNFHITNRCASCIAIEEATTKTLNTYFATELKQGRIVRQILNVDADANKTISEKYQAFGSGLFITRVLNGKETTTDLTGDGFKYAKNKEEKFIEILKTTISNYLK